MNSKIILGIDIGGSGIKGAPVDTAFQLPNPRHQKKLLKQSRTLSGISNGKVLSAVVFRRLFSMA
jgi:sugar (pentulose or hexulose) kinase